jgi:hypothetical protein
MGRHLAQLHVGHHRQPQGRRLPPPRRLPAGAGQRHHRVDAEAPGLSVDPADVPLQRLVLPVVDLGRQRHPRVPAPGARTKAIWQALAEHRVTHMCGAPIVMSTILAAPEEDRTAFSHTVEFLTAAAPPPESVLAAMADAGFNVTHIYGLTETYGPAVVNEWKAEWDALPGPERATRKARQGVRYLPLERARRARPRHHAARARRRRDHGRGDVPRQHRDEGLPEEPRGEPGGLRRRLVPFRRPRRAARRRLRAAQGPVEGHHHFRRREHFVHRGRGHALQAPRRPGRRRWWPNPTTPGARPLAPSSNSSPARRSTAEDIIEWCRENLARYKCPATSSSPRSPRPRPARSRSSSCARWRRKVVRPWAASCKD